MNASMMEEYLKFICNRRLSQLGLPEQFAGVTNPFAWMSEMMDLRKEKNFFETRVTDYQTGGALLVSFTAFPKSRSSRVAFLLPELFRLSSSLIYLSLFNKYLIIYTKLF